MRVARYARKAVRSDGSRKTVDRVEPGSQGRQQYENTFYTRREISPAGGIRYDPEPLCDNRR